MLWTYRDPSRDFRKVSDFDVESWRPGLRELYERSNTASQIAGAILAGHGGGGAFGEALTLANTTLDALENADEAYSEQLLIYFLWNWSGLLGSRSNDVHRCASCTCEWSDDAVIWFIPGEGFLCKNCMGRERTAAAVTALSPGGRRWLFAAGQIPPSELSRLSPAAASLKELKMLIKMLEPELFQNLPDRLQVVW
jgi:DNA repair protein RecO (recombination protein O)